MNTAFASKPRKVSDRARPFSGRSSRAAGSVGSRAGMPLFLQRKRAPTAVPQHGSPHQQIAEQASPGHEREADRMAESVLQSSASDSAAPSVQAKENLSPIHQPSPVGRHVESGIAAKRGSGQPLPPRTQERMEQTFGEDFSGVRIHTDADAGRLSESLGANGFTSGQDIFFGPNRFSPGSPEGDRLLAHELSHVVQQSGEAAGQVQFDLMQSLPTALGGFEIEMETRAAPRPGLEGHIRFLPDPSGPYSAQIGLIQAANVTDVAGRSTPTPGDPMDWRNVGAGEESGRMELMTTGTDGAPEGWYIDSRTAAYPRTSSVGPTYQEQAGLSPGHNEFGWLRSPTDIKNASLYDYPWFSVDADFDFETVAKGMDTEAVYGSLEWGFGIRSGVVQDEYVDAFDAESATFNEALERFRGYYAHEPIVVYFDTDQDVPIPGEGAKIVGALDYLNRYPDVQIEIEGYADERGPGGYNERLSRRRARYVYNLLTTLGVSATRIDPPVGMGETTQFSPDGGADAGSWRANRRVVVSFRRTQSTPIVMP